MRRGIHDDAVVCDSSRRGERDIGETPMRARARSFWHSNVGRRRRKRIRTNPTPPIHRSKGSFINIFDMLPTPIPFLEESRERVALSSSLSLSVSHARFLFALGFHRNNMLIARRRSLKSAPINSRDFWRNFAPSHRSRNVFRKILFARAFRRLERTLPYRVTCPRYTYIIGGIYFSPPFPPVRSC